MFTALFALGVVIITAYAGQVDLDQECVLYGEIGLYPLGSAAVGRPIAGAAASVDIGRDAWRLI